MRGQSILSIMGVLWELFGSYDSCSPFSYMRDNIISVAFVHLQSPLVFCCSIHSRPF